MQGAPSLSKEEARLAGRAFRSLGTGAAPALVSTTAKGSDGASAAAVAGVSIVLNVATFASDVLRELNRVRSDPAAYASELESLVQQFEGDTRFVHPKAVTPHVKTTMHEGKSAVLDLVRFLRDEVEPRAALTASETLNAVAARLADDPKASPDARLDAEHATVRFGTMQEATSHGDQTPAELIFNMLVGDGDKTRAIRKALLSSVFKEVGIATVKKGTAKRLNVISLANECHAVGELPRREVFTKGGQMPAGPAPQRAPGGAALPETAAAAAPAAAANKPKFCSQCGAKLSGGEKFCAGCGKAVL